MRLPLPRSLRAKLICAVGALVIAGGRALSPRAVRPGEGLHLFATMAELASFTRGLLNRK